MKCRVCKKEIKKGAEFKVYGNPYVFYCSGECIDKEAEEKQGQAL